MLGRRKRDQREPDCRQQLQRQRPAKLDDHADVQTGNFFKASSTGRCMNVRGGSTAAGAATEVDDCNTTSTAQKFAVQAITSS